MKEKTSYRVMKTHDFGDSIFYEVTCGCTDSDHSATLILECSENDPAILTLTLYQKVRWCDFYYYGDKWFGRFISRIKMCCKMLFKGWIELEGSMLFMDEEHIDGFIEALKEGKKKILEGNK